MTYSRRSFLKVSALGVGAASLARPQSVFGARRAADHILKEFNMPRRVDDDVIAFSGLKKTAGRINGDALRLLVFEGI